MNDISIKNITSRRKNAFRMLMMGLPLIILFSMEGMLRIAAYGDNFSLFVQNPMKGYDDYLYVNPMVGKKYFQNFHHTTPANDTFLKKKKKGAFRVFVMGSSTVYGFPFNRNLMFTRILHTRLQEAFPEKRIEVINTAISAINSFTLLDFADQILEQEPDAILVYAGHNEFYGALGIGSNESKSYFRRLSQIHLKLMDLKLYQWLRNTMMAGKAKLHSPDKSHNEGTLMTRIARNKQISLDSKEYRMGMDWYRQNMEELLLKMQKHEVPVFYSELISNVKDLPPFYSMSVEGVETAMEVYQEGKALEAAEAYKQALERYEYARDLDAVRFRASSEINEIIHALAAKYHATLVPTLPYFQEHSPHNLLGDNLLIDHVHPNIQGQFLMAEACFLALVTSEIISGRKPGETSPLENFKQNYGYTELDSLIAMHKMNIMKRFWPFVAENSTYKNVDDNYKPNSHTDSLAYLVARDKEVWAVDARLLLAHKYEEEAAYELAFREYKALLYTNPYMAINYKDAAHCLIQLNDFEQALSYLLKSLEYDNSYGTHYKLGELYLAIESYEKAIDSFERAIQLAPAKSEISALAHTYVELIFADKKEYAGTVAKKLVKIKTSR